MKPVIARLAFAARIEKPFPEIIPISPNWPFHVSESNL
jgi:hypothetical protein